MEQAFFDSRAALYDQSSASGLWSRIRSLEAKALMRLLGPLIGMDALDLGCGTGFYSEKMRERGARVFGVDSSAPMIEELLKKGFTGKRQDVRTLNLGRKFRVILAAGLIEYVEDEGCFFRLARTHCHSAGRLVMLVPRTGLLGWLYQRHHSWLGCPMEIRSISRLEAAAKLAGWRLEKVKQAGPIALALRFRPIPS